MGRRFENTIHNAFQKIIEMPQSASFAYPNIRYKVVDNFPNIITYDFDNLNINVFRVFNTNLNPESFRSFKAKSLKRQKNSTLSVIREMKNVHLKP